MEALVGQTYNVADLRKEITDGVLKKYHAGELTLEQLRAIDPTLARLGEVGRGSGGPSPANPPGAPEPPAGKEVAAPAVPTGPITDAEILDAAEKELGWRPQSIASRRGSHVTLNRKAPRPLGRPDQEEYHLQALGFSGARIRATVEEPVTLPEVLKGYVPLVVERLRNDIASGRKGPDWNRDALAMAETPLNCEAPTQIVVAHAPPGTRLCS